MIDANFRGFKGTVEEVAELCEWPKHYVDVCLVVNYDVVNYHYPSPS